MRSGVLISILILTLTGYGLYRLFFKAERVFTAPLMEVNINQVTSLLIVPPGSSSTEISLLREQEGWIASNGQVNIIVSTQTIQALLRALSLVKIKEIVATDRKYWNIYGVNQQQGAHIRVYAGKKLLEDFVVGKIDTDPQTQLPISYIRLASGEEVYAVAGNLAIDFNKDFNAFRNPLILQIEPGIEITNLELKMPDTIFQMEKTPEGWKSGASLLDSTAIIRYLRQLKNISGEVFADDFDEVQGSKYLYRTLILQGKNVEEPFVITCYRDTTLKMPFIIHSNQNSEAFFASDSLGLYHNIFKDWKDFPVITSPLQ